ncbi:acyl carrier protein [Streptomyces sp. NPDC000941]|uniref:acyl carrier protein n=1 Tax=Streptomyces sp. NPDC059679 TaxID=3346903 RepID=UPI0036887E62
MESDVRSRITDYLSRFFPVGELRPEEDFFKLGLVNSLFAMQIVAFVEHEFGITVENDDLHPDNFRSVQALDLFVSGKLSASAAQ